MPTALAGPAPASSWRARRRRCYPPCRRMENPDRPARRGWQTNRAYLFMLASALSFAVMGALSHLAGERCDWQIVALARTSLAFAFSAGPAGATGAPRRLPRPGLLSGRRL